jgi:hypothetical protein
MCAAVLPWITAAAGAASVVSAFNKPNVPDAPAPVTIEPTPATPTSQDVSSKVTDNNVLSDARERRRVAASWYSTNKTAGVADAPAVKKTLLGGLSTTLGG